MTAFRPTKGTLDAGVDLSLRDSVETGSSEPLFIIAPLSECVEQSEAFEAGKHFIAPHQ